MATMTVAALVERVIVGAPVRTTFFGGVMVGNVGDRPPVVDGGAGVGTVVEVGDRVFSCEGTAVGLEAELVGALRVAIVRVDALAERG
jgi:hypothetical protein